ncbi:hypothetical protein EIP91_010343 [Steccherinum ochraceum]|uniref:Uncharacterized protein n=1 Tax=Steccherinum ochraceum TaxID=92696 RepID=A0A4R0RCY6_9APHY|nr:hypothetical protein EIP91_010343 [Steccherinum ochraceum]
MEPCTTPLLDLESFVRKEGFFWPTYVEMEYVGTIQPPADIQRSRKEEVMFGFPLPREWLRKQNETTNSTAPPCEIQGDLRLWFPFICHILFPEWPRDLMTCKLAWTGNHDEPTCLFLRVGLYDHSSRPPKDLLKRMREVLAEKFGIVEKPGWYRDAVPEKRIVRG